MKNITKSIFLNAVACPTLGWLLRNQKIDTTQNLTLSQKFRMEQGLDIGKRARTIFPKGILVDDWNVDSAAKKTAELMNKPEVSTIFEATFLDDPFVAKADVLQREGESWHLIEVKSGVNDKAEYVDDLAYTCMVASRCGAPISGKSLLLVSKDYRLGMGNDALFKEIEHTSDVEAKAALFEGIRRQIDEKTGSETQPTPSLRFECKSCDLFDECVGKGVKNHIFEIPRLSQSKFKSLTEEGISSIEQIPKEFELTDNQSLVCQCVQSGQEYVGEDLKSQLDAIRFPAFFLDFETVTTAIPLYPDIAPYTQIPTQYSIHKCSATGQISDHYEYLSDPSRDSRKDLAEHLIKDLNGQGSIISYSPFEKTIINGLTKQYPELAGNLQDLVNRIVDLNAIVTKCFYHPEFHGSTSIKVTLPILTPKLSYADLDIHDGDTAVATFAYLALNRFKKDQAEQEKKKLLEYCKRDTLALVEVHKALTGYIR